MIVVSKNLVLSPPPAFLPNNPIVGWRNLVIPSNVSADGAAEGFPVSNLANPATYLRWRGVDSSEQHIAVAVSEVETIDYCAVAGHNFGSAEIPVSVEVFDGEDWLEIVQEQILPDDSPAIFRFAPESVDDLRLRLQPGLAPPEAAVLYIGKLLVLPRRIYVGHTPIAMGRAANVVNGRSERGGFLGRIVLGEHVESAVDMQNINPGFYRAEIDPFIEASKEVPFFFAWRPADYPHETGYCWITDEPKPVNQRNNGMMQVAFTVEGIVK